MALLFMDSFDHYATADLLDRYSTNSVSGSTTSINPTAGRRGSGCYRWAVTATNSQGALYSRANSSDPTIIFGCAFNTSNTPNVNGTQIFGLSVLGAQQFSIILNQAMTVSAWRGSPSGVLLGTTSASLVTGIYTYIEVKILIANTGGTVEIKFNGTTVLNLTGQDTQEQTTGGWGSLFLAQLASTSNSTVSGRNFDYDDLYICDSLGAAPWNNFLGDIRVDACYPTAPGATTGWTPSTGANWQNVDDAAPDDDTTYNSTPTVNAIDTFVVQNAPVVGATIFGIQHNINMKKSDAGAGAIAPIIRHSGVDNVGSTISPSTGYAYGLAINQINPGTGLAWTEADFNAAEFGYKRIV